MASLDLTKKLKKKHPNYKFVGINLRTSKEKWLSIIKDSPIENKNNQYRSADFDKIQKSLIIDNLNKSILTDDTLIIDAFANVFSNTTITDKQKTLTSR